ncbi:MAG TPA: NF038122 family metalloprotease [Xanthobacteraceae bacterium]|jgi:hypothetical protein
MTDTVLDTASTNAVVFAGGTFGTIDAVPVSGSFDTSLDHDWLAVGLIAGHDYVFSGMAVSNTLDDVAIDLRDSNRTILDSQGVVDAGPGSRPMFTYTATSSGTEYLDISGGGSNPASQTGQYFVTYGDAGADTILDTASTNASLTIGGSPVTGRINGVPESGSFDTSLDHDWFAINLTAGLTYTFSAQSGGGSFNDVAIDLRDSSRTILDGQGVVDAGANATSSFSYTATSSGTVYLDISAGGNNPAGLSGDYEISATLGGVTSDTVLDTASTNAVVYAGGTYGKIDAVPGSGSFDTSLDHDWLAVSLIAGHDYTFSGNGLGDLDDVAIDLRDSSRTILDSQGVVDAGANIISSFTYTATSSGTEYLDISAGGNNPAGQTGQYFVSYQDDGADTVLDTASTNASLSMGGTTSGRIDGMPEGGSFDTSLDHDWFAVNLVAGHSYTFSGTVILGSGNLHDVGIDLRDSSRNILDGQGVVDAGANATSSFTYTATSSGTAYLDISAGGNNPTSLAGGYQITATDNGLAPPPGLTINLIYDANALAAPQSLRDGMQAAANMLEAAFNDNIVVNIAVGYGEFGGVTLPHQNISEGNIGYTGAGTNGQGISEAYSDLRTLLLDHEGSADDITSVNALPNTSSLQGKSSFVIGTAQGKALGLVSSQGAAVDGQVGIGTAFTGNALIAAALHEITHAMGRIAGDSLDIFRFNENRSGSHVFGFARPATPAYFSIDGGTTDLADFGIRSDPGDFLNGGVQGVDPFNEILDGSDTLTQADLQVMDVLGFHRADGGPDTVLDTAANSASLTLGGATAGRINAVPKSGSFTTSLDHDWFAVSLIAGHVYTFSAQATFNALDNLNDVAIDLRNSGRTILDSQGVVDAGANTSSTFTYVATSSGTEYLDIAAGGGNAASLVGNYQITAADSGFASPNGNYWINAYDTANAASWAWSTSAYDANGNLTSRTGMNDDGTHWLTMYDVNNKYSWSNATITFDANWSWSSVTGTNDDGSHSVDAGTVAAAYDTLLWLETPYDPNAGSTAPLVLTGGSGNDVLAGHSGNDTLTGGPGNDILYGQDRYGMGGNNTFVFGPGFGQDKIMDFQTDHDTLQFSLSLLTNFAAAMADAKQVGASTVISTDANDSVTLQNVNMSSLTAANFSFS